MNYYTDRKTIHLKMETKLKREFAALCALSEVSMQVKLTELIREYVKQEIKK